MDNEIIEKIKAGESDTLEFKKSTGELKNALEDICAFANHRGGTLIFGVDPKGNVIGQDISNSTIGKVTTQILNLISPKVYPLITENSFLSSYEIEKYIYERDNERYRWERGKVGKDWNLISENKVKEFLHKVNINRNLNYDKIAAFVISILMRAKLCQLFLKNLIY